MSAKIALLKFIDRAVGGMVVGLLPKPRHGYCREPQSFLVIRPGGIGDAVHLFPMLLRLRECYPAADITLLCERRNAGVFVLAPIEMTVLCYDRPVEFIRALSGCYDVVIDSEQWHRLSAIVARLIRSSLKIGFASNDRQRLFTDPIPYVHHAYEAEVFLTLLVPLLGVSPLPFPEPPWLKITEEIYQNIDKLRNKIDGRYVVLFPGASVAARRWGGERFHLLACAINEIGLQVVVVGGVEDCATAAIICRDGSALDFSGKTTLAGSAALIAGADLLVSGDSGLLHIGVALGIPTVSFFGSGIAEKWAPRGEQHCVLNLHLSCSPCTYFGTTPACNKKVACLSGISVDTVFNAVKKQLQLNGNDLCPSS